MSLLSLFDAVRRAFGPAAARRVWKNGDVLGAEELASTLPDTDARRHLLFLTTFVRGDYRGALAHYDAIDRKYRSRGKLDSSVVDAYLHLHRYDEAVDFASRSRPLRKSLPELSSRAKKPLRVALEGTTVVPFAEHPYKDFLPGFEAELNGRSLVAHVDTGGPYLVLPVERARSFGIELTKRHTGFHGSRRAPFSFGVADSFRLGNALLENVPVVATPSLSGEQDLVIFGTSVLEPFLATLDYPNERLLLSPRAESHLAALPPERAELPFYLWGDHYMIARGGLGSNEALNFFVDSGLALLLPDAQGRERQVALLARPSLYRSCGVEKRTIRRGAFTSALPLSLGPLRQTEPFLGVEKRPSWSSFGGIRIDGLLGHAFLKRYAWTIDFGRRRYLFSGDVTELCAR